METHRRSHNTFLITDTDYHLSQEQIQLLNRGPSYVPVGQMHVSTSTDPVWVKQILILREQLGSTFTKYPLSINRKTHFQTELIKHFKEAFNQPLPSPIQERAEYEHRLIQSIRYQLEKDHLIVRRMADQSNLFYLGDRQIFEQKCHQYVRSSTTYEWMEPLDRYQPIALQLDRMIESIDDILLELHQTKRINQVLLNKLQIKKSNLKLPYLYFLPQLQKDGTVSVEPQLSSEYHSPIQALGQFLFDLLQPIVDMNTRRTSLFSGIDLAERLAHYDEACLSPETQFVTMKIEDLYNQLPHEETINSVGRFLDRMVNATRHNGLSFETIQRLVELFLKNNLFTYHEQIYRFKKGLPLNFAVSRTLVNIYLYYWQIPLLTQLRRQMEFYVRYHDRILISWNTSMDQLSSLIDAINGQHPDLQVTITVGRSVSFLGIRIENSNASIKMNVDHPSHQPRFVLPYAIPHPRLMHRKWAHWALCKAVRCCATIDDFYQERLYIEMTLLSNGYSLEFVKLVLKTFYNKYSVTSLQYQADQRIYQRFRSRLLYVNNAEKFIREQEQQWKTENRLIHLQYLYDWGQRCQFNTKFKQLWTECITTDPLLSKMNLKLKLSSIHCYTLNALLAQPTATK